MTGRNVSYDVLCHRVNQAADLARTKIEQRKDGGNGVTRTCSVSMIGILK